MPLMGTIYYSVTTTHPILHQWLAGRHARLQWDATITHVLILCNMSYSHAPLIIWCDHSYGPTLFTTWCPGGSHPSSWFISYSLNGKKTRLTRQHRDKSESTLVFLINFVLAIIRTLHWCLSHFLLQKGNDGSPVFHYLHCYICTMSTRAIFVMYKNRERDYEDWLGLHLSTTLSRRTSTVDPCRIHLKDKIALTGFTDYDLCRKTAK